MIDDSERRDVAARLRSIKDTREGCGHELCCDLWSAIFDIDYRCTDLCDECETAVLNSLADLIEPTWTYSESTRTHEPCDRDALLELADEMDAYSGHFSTGLQECTVQAWAVAIREALGVSK